MPLFFVLSGFVIHYNYAQPVHAQPLRGTYNFFVARFARLYPMYFVVLFADLFFHGFLDDWPVWPSPTASRLLSRATCLWSRAGTTRAWENIR